MQWSRTKRSEPGWVVLAPQGARLRAAHVKPADKPEVAWVWEGPWPDDADGQTQALASLRQSVVAGGGQGLRSDVLWLVERGQYQVLGVEAPEGLPVEEWSDALRWQLKGQTDFDVADAAVDWLRVPGNPQVSRREQVLAVLAPRAPLRPVVECLARSKWRLAAVDIPETALRNLSALTESDGRAQALLSFGAGNGLLVITHQGELLLARQIEVTSEALNSDDDARREAMVDRAALEVQRTLDTFERLHSHLSLGRLLLVPGPGMAGLGVHLSQFVSTPIESFDLSSRMVVGHLPALAGAASGAWLLVLGAALREAADGRAEKAGQAA